ncbi:MAG: PRTRC system protein B [Roseateles depolymerans]|uniref:PRTRC system protein B n=1 Tax=Roseateles depolymerans TaxID=76731 RepID=A0A2W5DEE5_9BURK|nr:MAG: PRTRC system protein B [Roseateles depolymerans]
MNRAVRFEIAAGREAPLKLSKAILLYRGGNDAAFATVHEIGMKGNAPLILEGKALTPSAAVQLALDLAKNANRGGFVPECLLYLDGDTMAWWVPPARRHIAFRSTELGAPERGEVVPHPGLVFRVNGRRHWHVWAVTGAARPTESTPLLQAPYFNVYGDGGICTGNVTLPDGTTAERIEAWNRAFFGSFFTHPNVNGKLVTYRGGAYKFWRDMLDGRHPEFPERVLVPSRKTLGEVLAHRESGA